MDGARAARVAVDSTWAAVPMRQLAEPARALARDWMIGVRLPR